MKVKRITEGKSTLFVPDLSVYKRIYDAPVFYNPEMRLSRDIGVAAVKVFGPKLLCDPLAATGARGIRYVNEGRAEQAVLGDIESEAVKLIRKNCAANRVKSRTRIENKDANVILSENYGKFDFVDIDPFGSPAPFTDSAVRACRRNAVLTVTATDTACLSGVSVNACRRKYFSQPLSGTSHHESALRILLYFLARTAAQHGKAIKPLISHATSHYYKVYVFVQKGLLKADKCLKKIGYISYCKCGYFDVSGEKQKCPACAADMNYAGPLWKGALHDPGFISKTLRETDGEAADLLSSLKQELDYPLFYDTHAISSFLRKNPLESEAVFSGLKETGYRVSKTHISGTGFKTDAPYTEIIKLFRNSRRR